MFIILSVYVDRVQTWVDPQLAPRARPTPHEDHTDTADVTQVHVNFYIYTFAVSTHRDIQAHPEVADGKLRHRF